MFTLKEITINVARNIIKYKEPLGLFWFVEDNHGSIIYHGIDNSTGKALLKDFYNKVDCFNWLSDEHKCRICGCTWHYACPGGCYWVEPDLCSECAGDNFNS